LQNFLVKPVGDASPASPMVDPRLLMRHDEIAQQLALHNMISELHPIWQFCDNYLILLWQKTTTIKDLQLNSNDPYGSPIT
jgi:hypothetical protein